MPFDTPVTLKPASCRDFYAPLLGLFLLALNSALLSQRPILFILLAVPLVGAGLIGFILEFSKFNDANIARGVKHLLHNDTPKAVEQNKIANINEIFFIKP